MLFQIFSFLSVAASLGVFILGIDTMRGRGEVLAPFIRTYKNLTEMAYDECDTFYSDKFRYALVDDMENAISNHRKQASIRGRRLRYMSFGLLSSVCFAICSILINLPN